MTFTLKQVETFRTVYETESVTAAARRLDVSPATVSATLAALEASIESVSYTHLDVYKRQRLAGADPRGRNAHPDGGVA